LSALRGRCSTIHDNSLYVFSPDAFQSIQLRQNATWVQMPNGTAVAGAACAKVSSGGNATDTALFVIGGEATDNTYRGLQRFTFSSKSWETLPVVADVLQGRTTHGVAYLSDSQSILIYAGSQPVAPSVYSSQTFLLSTKPPYNIESYTSEAPPLADPIIQPWNSSHAVMVGGSASNTDVWTFGPVEGWQRYQTDLSKPLDPADRAVVLDGNDGSKVMNILDLQASPNTVTGVVLQKADGTPATTGQTVGGSVVRSKKSKRDLTLSNWPVYNSTNAPTVTRDDSSIARDTQSGLIAIAGGSTILPVALFDPNQNSWLNASTFFNAKNQQPLIPTSTSTTSVSATATPTASASSPVALPGSGDNSGHSETLSTVGIVLGTIFAFAALFILILMFLRWRRQQALKNKGAVDEKASAGFPNDSERGFPPAMIEGAAANRGLVPPNTDGFRTNHDSFAIIANKFTPPRTAGTHQTKDSFDSTARLVKPRDEMTTGEPLEMTALPGRSPVAGSNLAVPGAGLDNGARAGKTRSTGWSRYFATSEAAKSNPLSHIPSVYIKSHNDENAGEGLQSNRTSQLSRIPSSSIMAPLDLDFARDGDGQRLSHVAYSSPSFADSREDLAKLGRSIDLERGQKASIVNPTRKSHSQSFSSYGDRSTLSSTMTSDWYTTSAHSAWSPTRSSFKDHLNDRPGSSSTHANSVYSISDRPRPSQSRGKSPGFFPGTGTSYRPPRSSHKVKMSHAAGPTSAWASHDINHDAPLPPPPVAKAEDRAITAKDATGSDAAPFQQHQPSKSVASDMSWVNLDLNKPNA
jgi:hypothetical protein